MKKNIQGDFQICISVPLTATDNTNYAAYADDISCAGKLRKKTWSKNRIFCKGKLFLIIATCEPQKIETAKAIFKDTNSKITNEGKRHIEAVVGTEKFRKERIHIRF